MDESICVWPDGTWCEMCELSQMSHRSDDYAVVSVGDNESSEEAADRYARSIGAY